METRLGSFHESQLLDFFLHLLDIRINATLSELYLSDLLVNLVLVFLAISVLITKARKGFDQAFVLIRTVVNVILCLLKVLRTGFLELANLLLHVLEMLV